MTRTCCGPVHLQLVQGQMASRISGSNVMEAGRITCLCLAPVCQAPTRTPPCRWFIGISRGVKYLHSCRPTIVHRDLKPENIMLTGADMSSNEAKVLDLGLHTRKTARHTLPGEMDGSWYGGTSYDAVKFNGSVYAGRGALCFALACRGKTLGAAMTGRVALHAVHQSSASHLCSPFAADSGLQQAVGCVSGKRWADLVLACRWVTQKATHKRKQHGARRQDAGRQGAGGGDGEQRQSAQLQQPAADQHQAQRLHRAQRTQAHCRGSI